MKYFLALISLVIISGVGTLWYRQQIISNTLNSGAPPYGESEDQVPQFSEFDWLLNWKRPDGPAKVGLQVGHWKNDELPEELSKLIGNTGASGGGKSEIEVNLAIAEATAEILREQGIIVEILPATVPEKYWSDVFVAIHADGNLDNSKSGYKAAAPWRDFSGKANKLVELVEANYENSTGLVKDNNISRNMRGYYAFSWWRYDHAIHPKTTGIILETGFLTSPSDRKVIVSNYQKSAVGLAQGILEYLKSESLLPTAQ